TVLDLSSDFNMAKNLGLAGAIIVLIMSFVNFVLPLSLQLSVLISYVLAIAMLAGEALIVLSLYKFSKLYQEEAMFRYALYFIAAILVGNILSSLAGAAALSALAGASISDFMGFALLVIVIAVVALIIAYYFLYKSLGLLAEKSGEGLFRIAGILMLVGAVTLIIVIGFLLFIAGIIALIIAYINIKPPAETVQPPTAPPSAGEGSATTPT
ncbi:MAG: DUF996 domain-containing protein, partial [Acidilobaceae archaeon]